MIERVCDKLFIRTSHIQQMQSVILIQEDALHVFDPAYFVDEIAEIRLFVSEHEKGRKKRVLLTHSDFDHIAGVHYFNGYRVFTASTWDEGNEVRAIDQIELFDSQFYVNRPWPRKMPRVPVDRRLNEGDHVDNLYFYHAKGHTNDGMMTLWDATAIIGDYLSALEFPFIYTSYQDYLATMRQMRRVFDDHAVELVITQHGPYAVGGDEISRRFSIAEDYLSQLEEVIREGLQTGRGADEVVKIAGERMAFDGKPIALGLSSAHTNNVKLTFAEFGGSHREQAARIDVGSDRPLSE